MLQFLVDETSSSALKTMISGLDFSVLTTYFLEVCEVMIPVLVGIYAVKKGISWLLSFIRRA